jgi:hypothetical protein
MDPLSVVSVAAAAVQFTDFGARLISETVMVYRDISGEEARVVELGQISRGLGQLCRTIDEKVALLARPGQHLVGSDAQLLKECRRCNEISRDISQSISKIRGRGIDYVDFGADSLTASQSSQPKSSSTKTSKYGRFSTALSLVLNRGQINTVAAKLSDIRSSLMLAMISNL